MTTYAYDLWWQLHVRVARGETLSAKEQADYQAGLDQLDLQEAQIEPESLLALRAARAQIAQQTAEHTQMLARSAQLERQIAEIESAIAVGSLINRRLNTVDAERYDRDYLIPALDGLSKTDLVDLKALALKDEDLTKPKEVIQNAFMEIH